MTRPTSARRTGSRRTAREYALLSLYMVDLGKVSANAGLQAVWSALVDGEGLPEQRPAETDEVEFAQQIVLGIEGDREAIDALIDSCSTNWRLRRMPIVDRNILRLAAYELLHREDIPGTVTCNEAIELAKRYGSAESRAFVNGIVDRMGRQLGRLTPRRRK